MEYTDEFGYLPVEDTIEWTSGRVEPSAQFADAQKWMTKFANRDGYLYPPLIHTRSWHPSGKTSKVPKSDRPALLHKLPPTHALRLDVPHNEDLRLGIAGFFMHFAGFLYGHRCQFHDWWVDSRIPLRPQADRHVRKVDADLCFTRAFEKWESWSKREQILATNALYLHGRAPSYEWPWERFQAEYQILDALFALAKPSLKQKTVTHSNRIQVLCDEYGLAFEPECVRRIVGARNELIHEALWGGANPLSSEGEPPFPLILHRLTSRLLLAMVGVRGTYIGSAWWGLGHAYFKAE
jgi:hypothetical protein